MAKKSARPRIKRLDTALLTELSRQALSSPRLRDNYNFHERPDERVQRLCIALEPDSYVRPHRHPEDGKWEFLLALTGTVLLLTFDAEGHILERLRLEPHGALRGVEISPDTWHTLLAEAPGTVILEVKQGPYLPVAFSNFAAWSPREGSPQAREFQNWCRSARPGERYAPH